MRPPTPPIEQSQGNSTTSRSATALETSTADGTSSVNNNSSSRPSEDHRSSDPCPSLTPAAVSLVNKYSQQIVGNMQLQLAEMSKDLLASAAKERDSLIEERVEQEKEQMQWTLVEVQHNHKLKIAEMKACWEAEMSKAMENMVNKMTKEKEEAVAETKKKQWCADCWKEALYYCCWNTSYCSYACQQHHWTVHQHECRQEWDSNTTQPTTMAATVVAAAPAATVVPIRPPGTEKSLLTGEKTQPQKFSIQNSLGGAVNVIQGDDLWRNRQQQNIQFVSTQQLPAVSTPGVRLTATASQPLQQFQYVHAFRPAVTPAAFQASPQVQLVGQRPIINMVLPSGMILRTNQPGVVTRLPSHQSI